MGSKQAQIAGMSLGAAATQDYLSQDGLVPPVDANLVGALDQVKTIYQALLYAMYGFHAAAETGAGIASDQPSFTAAELQARFNDAAGAYYAVFDAINAQGFNDVQAAVQQLGAADGSLVAAAEAAGMTADISTPAGPWAVEWPPSAPASSFPWGKILLGLALLGGAALAWRSRGRKPQGRLSSSSAEHATRAGTWRTHAAVAAGRADKALQKGNCRIAYDETLDAYASVRAAISEEHGMDRKDLRYPQGEGPGEDDLLIRINVLRDAVRSGCLVKI